MKSYNKDLKNVRDADFDICKIYSVVNAYNSDIDSWQLNLIWEREPELTDQQKKILELEETINKAKGQIEQLKKGE